MSAFAGSGGSSSDEDPFDSIVVAEDRAYQESYREGLRDGLSKAQREGHATGVFHGAALGQELGFYWGFLLTAKAKCCKENEKISDRALKETAKLLDKIERIAADAGTVDPTDQALFDEIDLIRAKFKQVASLLNVAVGTAKRLASASSLREPLPPSSTSLKF